MRWTLWSVRVVLALGVTNLGAQAAPQAQTAPQAPPSAVAELWTWNQVKDRFELNNTTLQANRLNIDELKAEEITAHLRPNPDLTVSADGTQIVPSHGVWKPFAGTLISPAVSQLFERRNKRDLRYQAAKEGTAVGLAQATDSERHFAFQLAHRVRSSPPG